MNHTTSVHRRQAIIVALVTAIALLLFVDRAFNIDDPLFVWLAQHIQDSPWDFYGFPVNWYGIEQPMHTVTKNPPLAGYYLALAASILGWNEVALHLAFLLPALGAALGTLALARRFCASPVLATLLGLLTPVFLIASTSVMCDTLMLALWCWSLVLWIVGIERRSALALASAAVLIGLCGLTKYFGVSLLPLVAVYAALKTRRLGSWALYLLIPLAIFVAYQWATREMYGQGLLLDAADYARTAREVGGVSTIGSVFVALNFAGACLIPALFFAPLLWPRRVIAAAAGAFAVALIVCLSTQWLPGVELAAREAGDSTGEFDGLRRFTPILAIQFLLATLAGLSLLGLTGTQGLRRREADDWLLALWVLGTFVFAGFVNWTNNGRSILPMAPAVGILLVRRLERRPVAVPVWRAACVVSGVMVALLATWADTRWSNAIRAACQEITLRQAEPGRTLWFQGHWGFQHYMAQGGAKAIDFQNYRIAAGDRIVLPSNTTNIVDFPEDSVRKLGVFVDTSPSWIRTLDLRLGAGFYSSAFGPLPFAAGNGTPDVYVLLEVIKPMQRLRMPK